ncbi:MAG: Ig-like domain-containing protein, partial [Anaerolineae bacterium]
MGCRRGCGLVVFVLLFGVVACLVFAALAWGLVETGEISLYGPRVVTIEPAAGYAFRPTTPITLTFDQPMDPISVESAFSFQPAVSGTFHWDRGYTQMTFVPGGDGYQPGNTYTFRLEAGAKGAPLPRTTDRAFEGRFFLPPLLDAVTSLAEQEYVGPYPLLEATANFDLDCDATLRSFTIEPEVQTELACDGRTVSVSPAAPLEPGSAYVAEFVHLFLEDDVSPRPGVRWDLQTAPPLTVVGASPAEGDRLSDLWTPVRIRFSRPVDPDSVLERFSLSSGSGLGLPGVVTWERGGATFVFQPQEALLPDTSYEYRLEPQVRDSLGFELAEGVSHSFATEPMLLEVAPPDGAAQIPITETIRLSFSRAMDQETVEAGLLISPPLDFDITWDGNQVLLAPQRGMAPDTGYQASIGATVRDASGAPLAQAYTWTFSTQPLLLAQQTPEQGAVDLRQTVDLAFAQSMDRRSVEAALAVSPATPGEWVWSDDSRTVAFQPETGWLPGEDYTVTLGGIARTADGYHSLSQDRSWEFSTAPVEVQFGQGPNVQVMAAGGERAFQLVVQGANVAEFQLHPITPTQFLDLYSSGFRGIGPEEAQVLPGTFLTPTVTWREPLVALDDPAYDGWWLAEAQVPDDLPTGLYILTSPEASASESSLGSDHLLLVVTEHVLVLKQSRSGGAAPAPGSGDRLQAQIVAWDTELSSGAPVVSATVRLYDRDGAFLAEGLTGTDGGLTLEVPGDPGPLVALSDHDGDITVCGLSNEWGQAGWGWWWTEPPSRSLYNIYSYTDRPIYRPGQVVYFKDWIRADDDVSYTLLSPDLPVTVRLRDARDNVAATQVLTTSQFGTISGTFQLVDEPMLGTWHMETELGGTTSRLPLQVEEYRKPEYEVVVRTPEKVWVQGETITVTVEAAYYFGQPVAGAEIDLTVYPAYPDDDLYGSEIQERFSYPIHEERGRTDADGRWTVELPTDDSFYSGTAAPQIALALEATVTDDTGQSVSSYETVVVRRTAYGLALWMDRHGFAPDEQVTFSATVHDRQGAPVSGAEISAQVLAWDESEVAAATATTGDDGQAAFSVNLTEQGWYVVRASTMDDTGRHVTAGEFVWVYDPSGQAPWYGGQWGSQSGLSVSADRSSYQVGDEAQVLVHTSIPGSALLTFERGETRGAQPVTLVSGTNLITVPIRADFAPNVYVSVSQFGPVSDDWWPEQSRPEAELHTASAELVVPMDDRLLTVTLTADRATYGPGDEATFSVRVTDHEDQPAVAEVSLAVVDEAIYALAQDMSKDPFEVFYGPRSNNVQTFDSLRPTRWLYPEGAGQGGGDGEGASVPRRDFRDTAYWTPALVTDENGEVTLTLQLPDNLTEWRVLARAITTDTLVGQATTGVMVSQDTVVRPALPRFLIQGDAITLTALVHNYTAQAVSATVGLQLDDLLVAVGGGDEPAADQIIHVPAGGSASARWPVVALRPGEAQVLFESTATSGGTRLAGRDAVE